MQQPIQKNRPRDLEMRFFHWIKSHDIQLALDDGIFEYPPIYHPQFYSNLDWLELSETISYHRQLFSWRLYPVLWALSRTATKNTDPSKDRSDTGN
jgi:hypothetical protein